MSSSNRLGKMSPVMLDVWLGAIRRLDGGLLHGATSIHTMSDPDGVASLNLEKEALSRGMIPGALVFIEKVKHSEHIKRLRCSDLALDMWRVGGGMTAMDALWAGTPWITPAGDWMVSRFGLSALQAAGLGLNGVVQSLKGYEDAVAALATR